MVRSQSNQLFSKEKASEWQQALMLLTFLRNSLQPINVAWHRLVFERGCHGTPRKDQFQCLVFDIDWRIWMYLRSLNTQRIVKQSYACWNKHSTWWFHQAFNSMQVISAGSTSLREHLHGLRWSHAMQPSVHVRRQCNGKGLWYPGCPWQCPVLAVVAKVAVC